MTTSAVLAIAVVIAVFLMLALTKRSPDTVLAAGLGLLVVLGVVGPRDALAGFGNEGVMTIAVLYIMAAGMRDSGGIWLAVSGLFRRPGSLREALARVTLPTTALSGFLNNTPLVLMLLPVINDWAKKYNLSPSKLLIPLSYASILGGMMTLVGTSTNLLVNGMMMAAGMESLGLFSISWVGVPVAAAGVCYLIVAGPWLLPDRTGAAGVFNNPREYSVEMLVEEGSPLVGQTIEEAGLRHLPGLYVAEVDRRGDVIFAVGPDLRLEAGDQLVFVGVVDSIVDLQKIRGLAPATRQVFKLNTPRGQRCLVEAVISSSSPFVGLSIREGRFRNTYDAAVIAVARHGKRVNQKIGDIVLQPGDTLLVEAHPFFADLHRNSRDFYLVSRVEGYTPPNYAKAPLAMAIMAGMVLAVVVGWLTMLQAALVAGAAMLGTRCVTAASARRNIDVRLLVCIASAFGIGQALATTGAAEVISRAFIGLAGGNVWWSFLLVYLTTMLLTELITNNAAAAVVFPIALATANGLGVSPVPFLVAIMFAASLAFTSPIGYQTHLMVYGPGGYRFSDFVRVGLPLNLLTMTVAVSLIPRVWGF